MNSTAMLLIYLTILMGPLIVLFSNNLFLMWIGLEMNLLAMIPIMISQHHMRATEAASKYFITQATASMLLLLSIMLNFKQLGLWIIQPQTNYFITLTMFISLAMKLGLAPFHSWLPEVTQGIQLNIGLLLLTWQKLAPLSMLYQIYEYLDHSILMMSAMISIFIGAWNGLNQTQVRKIMAYSSISHMGWMISICPYNPNLTMLNYFIYTLLTISMFLMISIYSTMNINSMSLLWNKMPTLMPIMSAILMSMGGLPPLTGFLPKWLIISELSNNNCTIMATLMAMMALINLFFYMRIIYSTSLTVFPTNNNSKMLMNLMTKNTNPILPMFIVLSTMTLPLSPLLQ
uniref:NADH-ubiquinone oxidoreductase chain 2 n=1 Tax=Wiedomys cerradensis TaxID=1353928 RepID=A0A0A0QMP3_9RODE|nr:NADH dehydrogenase subunit 2 [Wiedomys cerradensis]AIR76235.1 NADH dehydrogenase subunit 2 [Wiedomys cerradensis]